MRVCYLEAQLFEPSGPRQHDIRKTPSCLVHEQIDANDQLCLVEAVGDVSGIGERRQQLVPSSSKTFSRPSDRASVMSGIWFGM
jgi:hypothetical protein